MDYQVLYQKLLVMKELQSPRQQLPSLLASITSDLQAMEDSMRAELEADAKAKADADAAKAKAEAEDAKAKADAEAAPTEPAA